MQGFLLLRGWTLGVEREFSRESLVCLHQNDWDLHRPEGGDGRICNCTKPISEKKFSVLREVHEIHEVRHLGSSHESGTGLERNFRGQVLLWGRYGRVRS
jgi:hypothetical protein